MKNTLFRLKGLEKVGEGGSIILKELGPPLIGSLHKTNQWMYMCVCVCLTTTVSLALTYRSVIVQIGRWSDSVTYWICTLMKRDVSAGQNARYIENFAMKECNHSFKIRNLLNFIFLALVDLKTKPQQGTCQQYM